MMDFVKNWFLWIILGVLLLATGVVRFVVVPGYEEEANKAVKELLHWKDEVERNGRLVSMKSAKAPTKGDIELFSSLLEDIRKEGEETLSVWVEASGGLSVSQDIAIDIFPIALHERCLKERERLAESVGRRIVGGEDPPLVYVSEREDYDDNVIDETVDLEEEDEMIVPWRRYLILKRIHDVAGDAAATVRVRVPTDAKDAEGETVVVWNDGEGVRTVERLGKISFGAVLPATRELVSEEDDGKKKPGKRDDDEEDAMRRRDSAATSDFEFALPEELFGGDDDDERKRKDRDEGLDEEDFRYFDVWPVSFSVTAHPAVIRNMMTGLLDCALEEPKFLFVPRDVSVERFSDSETRPEDTGGREIGGEDDVSVDVTLLHSHEPPVKAEFSYYVYHFDPTAKLMKIDPDILKKSSTGGGARRSGSSTTMDGGRRRRR